jgi:RimJ/RimL family protein N-acetyltransferase
MAPHLPAISLRDVQLSDIPAIYFESDPAFCTMAMIKPRSIEAFQAVWDKIFRDRASGAQPPGVTQKVILTPSPKGPEICGSIGCWMMSDQLAVGYGIARPYWGRGIASRALALLLAEMPVRPLHARAAASNSASIRVLTKNGFVAERTEAAPETDRYLACDETTFVLR